MWNIISYCSTANSFSEFTCKLNEAKFSQNNKMQHNNNMQQNNQKLYNTYTSRNQIRGQVFLKFLHVSDLLYIDTYLY